MNNGYPIVEQRPLEPSRLGLFGRRARLHLPALPAHHVRVYQIEGQLVQDNGRGGPGRHADATHVTVVDIRRAAPVSVQFDAPSADAVEFTVQVSFLCAVTDPVLVVRVGLDDLPGLLREYLRSHRRIFELALGYNIADVNEARRVINAQIVAYGTVRPPKVDGMEIGITNAEVLAPAEMAAFARERRSQHHQQVLKTTEEEHHQQLIVMRQQYQQLIDERRRDFERVELAKAEELIGHDPRRALAMAFAAGQIDASALAERLQTEREREERADRLAREAEREDERRLLDARLELLRELASRGHLDMVNLNVDRLVNDVVGSHALGLDPVGAIRQLTSSNAETPSPDVREEDDD